MKDVFAKGYGWVHSKLVEGARRLPVSAQKLGPLKGVITDMRRWIDEYKSAYPQTECWYKQIDAGAEIRYPAARRLEELAAIFLDDRNIVQPEVFVASVPNTRLMARSGILISPDDRVFEQSCSWKSFFFTHDIEYNSLRRTATRERLAGHYATLISRHGASYYHWFTECLPRLYALQTVPLVPLLVQHPLSDWQVESLSLLGIKKERLVQMPEGCYELEHVYFPSFPAYATFTNDWTFAYAGRPLEWVRRQLCGQQDLNLNKRVYVSRAGVTHRRIINEEQVMRVLEGEGFLIVDTSRLSLAEKISVFKDCSLTVGVHGAGLTHSLFAPPDANLIEVLDPAKVTSTYYQMVSALGQNYWYLFAVNEARRNLPIEKVNPEWPFQVAADSAGVSRKGYDDLEVPIDLLLRTVSEATTRTHRSAQMLV